MKVCDSMVDQRDLLADGTPSDGKGPSWRNLSAGGSVVPGQTWVLGSSGRAVPVGRRAVAQIGHPVVGYPGSQGSLEVPSQLLVLCCAELPAGCGLPSSSGSSKPQSRTQLLETVSCVAM